MMATMSEFTATEQRLLDVLGDGNDHTPRELHACLIDELQPIQNVKMHICNIRKKIRPKGMDIVCITRGQAGIRYRQVRLLHPSARE